MQGRPCRYAVGLIIVLLGIFAGTAAAQEEPLRVGIKQVSPFVIKGTDDSYTGISIDLWEEIAGIVDADFQYVEMPNTEQLITACEKGDVDLAISAITMTPNRLKRVDFSNTMFNSSVSVAVRSERPGMMDTLLYFFDSWLLNVLMTLSVILVLVGTVTWLFEMRRNPEFPRNPIRGIGQGIWWASATMTSVGYGDTVPRSLPGRLLGVLLMFIGVLMVSSFTATIASSLTSENIRSQVNDLIDLGRMKVGAVEGENPITLLRRRGITARGYTELDEALSELADGQLDAVVHDRPIIQYMIHMDPDLAGSIRISNIDLRKEEYGIAVGMPSDPNQRNALVYEINAALIQVKSSGRYDEILGQYLGF
jgi:ABC-type amino acid transport substrate-binding protein